MPVYPGTEQREFFVWIDPRNFFARNNLERAGCFTGGPIEGFGDAAPENLQFVPNPQAIPGPLSPFHNGIIARYRIEYNLEQWRHWHPEYTRYPSRLWALFLLDSREDALVYKELHPEHVHDRILKRCITVGAYRYSKHDANWIDFLRGEHYLEDKMLTDTILTYWSGERTDRFRFSSKGSPWIAQPSMEILFYGRVDFPNKNAAVAD